MDEEEGAENNTSSMEEEDVGDTEREKVGIGEL